MIFDLIVIGSGPAGQRSAMQAAKAGKQVAIVEQHGELGGGCLHSGTLPSKSFRESVYRWSLSSRGKLGSVDDGESKAARKKIDLPDMHRLLARKERVVTSEAKIVFDQLKRNGIKIFHGRARMTSPNEVEVTSENEIGILRGKFVFIAVGAKPVAPDHIEVDGKWVFDSDTILQLEKLPRTMVVLGAGIIGCEYASMFSMAGTHVILADRRHEILASVDREIVNHLVTRFDSEGVEILLEVEAKEIIKGKSGIEIHLSNGRVIEADSALIALGRNGNTRGLGLAELGIQLDARGIIKVNEAFQTSIPTVYAVGDVIGTPALAATSMEQGRRACCHAFQLGDYEMPKYFPYGIYTIPEISMVGPTEEDLISQKVDFVAGKAHYRELARGQIVGDRWGLLKLLVDKKTLKILGIHIVGDSAADLVHIGQAVMAFGGDVQYFIRSVFNYPTFAEAYKTAAFHAINQIAGKTKTR